MVSFIVDFPFLPSFITLGAHAQRGLVWCVREISAASVRYGKEGAKYITLADNRGFRTVFYRNAISSVLLERERLFFYIHFGSCPSISLTTRMRCALGTRSREEGEVHIVCACSSRDLDTGPTGPFRAESSFTVCVLIHLACHGFQLSAD